jgi:hypothetical protein
MALNFILYILAAMIFYDLSLHLLELVLGRQGARKLKPYYPTFKIRGKRSRKYYTVFWTAYWGIAFALVIVYLATL